MDRFRRTSRLRGRACRGPRWRARNRLPGDRQTVGIGLALPARAGVAQLSCNVEDHVATPLATLLAAVERHAPVAETELVGLAPRAAFEGFPPDMPVRNRAFVEDHLAPREVT